MRNVFVKLVAMVLCAVAAADLAAQDAERIIGVSSSIRTLECSFTQSKYSAALDETVVSSGRMVYDSRSSSLRWEYLSPVNYAVVFSGGSVSMRMAGGDVTRVTADNMFRRISELMAGMVSGKCFAPGSGFDCDVSENGGAIVAEMTPRDRDMKRMMDGMTLYFDGSSCLLQRLEMREKGGDVTVIEMSGINVNGELAPDSFEL